MKPLERTLKKLKDELEKTKKTPGEEGCMTKEEFEKYAESINELYEEIRDIEDLIE